MLFKNATIYLAALLPSRDHLEEMLSEARFTPILQAGSLSQGFEPVFEDQLVFQSSGFMLMKFTSEKKVVPGSAVKTAVKDRVAKLAEEQGYPPGKKQTKELKEAVIDELTARALSSRRSCLTMFDINRGRLIIDSTSGPMLDAVTRLLYQKAGIEIKHLDKWPHKQFRSWLGEEDNVPSLLTLDDRAEFEMPGSLGTTISFKRADLTAPEVLKHIYQGAEVINLAVTYNDRLSFLLEQGNQLRGIRAADILDEVQVVPDADRFENDFVLAATEIRGAIDYLTDLANAA